MKKEVKNNKMVLMIGPDPEGLGGISRVVKLWQASGLFGKYNIKYVSSVTDSSHSKLLILIKGLIKFILLCQTGCRCVYIHTASYNSFYRKSLFIAMCYLLNKKVILHIHPSYFFTFLSHFKGLKKRVLFFALRKVDSFVVLTREMQSNIKSLFPGKEVYVLRNSVNLKAMINKNGFVRDRNRLLYLGWYNKEKGVYDLVDAVQMLVEQGSNIEMNFFGTKEVNQLRKYVEEKGLTGKIRVNGWANDDEKLKALYTSAMLILPSHTEGIPNVILEAMATKTPIVSTLVGGLKEVLENGENAIITEPQNPLDLSEKISTCLKNEMLRKKIAENAYREVEQKYDLPIINKEFSEIMRNI